LEIRKSLIPKLRQWMFAMALGLMFAGAAFAETPSSDTPEETASRISLWPDRTAPGSAHVAAQQRIVERSDDAGAPDRIITHVTQPYLVVYRPRRPNGAALLVTPGGGYERIVLDKEGSALVPAFVEQAGVMLFVLRYRLPGDAHADARNAPLADAQRALRLIRARAGEWNINPRRIGVIGFSAGGHVAASLGTRFGDKAYTAADATDRQSARPDFMLLIYPVIDMSGHAHRGSRARLLGATLTAADIAAYSPQRHVDADTPPTFLLHAADDDSVPVDNSLLFFDALRRARVPAELHVYPHGGHGFGVRAASGPLARWPQLALDWMRSLSPDDP
jgi:acetyl esterase/lipase